jgi:hypothetical protein
MAFRRENGAQILLRDKAGLERSARDMDLVASPETPAQHGNFRWSVPLAQRARLDEAISAFFFRSCLPAASKQTAHHRCKGL